MLFITACKTEKSNYYTLAKDHQPNGYNGAADPRRVILEALGFIHITND